MIIETDVGGFLGTALVFTSFCLIVALLLGAIRLLVGPTLADRVVALDFVSMIIVVFLVVFKLISGIDAYIYAAITLALIAFLATVAFAHYIERSRTDSDD